MDHPVSPYSGSRLAAIPQTIRFDARWPGRLVGGVFVLCGLVLAVATASLRHKLGSMSEQQTFAALLLTTLTLFWTAYWCFRHYAGVHGIVERNTITVRADRIFGLATLAPTGKLTVARFIKLRLHTTARWSRSARVTLIAAPPGPDIVLFHGRPRQAERFANEVALLLRLPIETLPPKA